MARISGPCQRVANVRCSNSLLNLSLEDNSSTYSNVRDEQSSSCIQYLLHWEIEDALTELIPRGQQVRLNTEPLLRMNQYDRYQTMIALKNGFMSREEVREREHSGQRKS